MKTYPIEVTREEIVTLVKVLDQLPGILKWSTKVKALRENLRSALDGAKEEEEDPYGLSDATSLENIPVRK